MTRGRHVAPALVLSAVVLLLCGSLLRPAAHAQDPTQASPVAVTAINFAESLPLTALSGDAPAGFAGEADYERPNMELPKSLSPTTAMRTPPLPRRCSAARRPRR
jgi:hypothetical protein